MVPIYLAVAAVAFLASCAKEYVRVTKRPSSPPPPPPAADPEPVSDPGDPCPGQSCAGAEETKGKGINGSAWVVGAPTVTDTSVKIGETDVDTSQSIYSVKKLDNSISLGFKVTTHIPQRAFLFASGKATPEHQNIFDAQITQLGDFLLQASSQQYACYLSTTDTSATIYVSGHTDTTDSDEANFKLSKERAKTVAGSLYAVLSANSNKLTAPITIKALGMGEVIARSAGRPDDVANDADRKVVVETSSTPPYGVEASWEEIGKITPQ